MSLKPIKYSIVYNRRKIINNNGESAIEIKAVKDDNRKYFATGIYVRPDQWNAQKKTIFNHTGSPKLNDDLKQFQNKLILLENDIKHKTGNCSINDLDNAVKTKQEVPVTFYDFAKSVFKDGGKLSKSRKDMIIRSLDYFKEFSNDVLTRDMNPKLLDEFQQDLIKKNYGANYIKKLFQPLKHYAEKAVKFELLDYSKNPFTNHKLKGVRTKRTYLEIEEVQLIENIQFDSKNKDLELIRDMFLFQCYTAMRFSDVSVLRPNDITEKAKGFMIDNTDSEKTDKPFYLPLYALFPINEQRSKPEQILLKYWNKKNAPFFNIAYSKSPKSNLSYTNKQLKIIQKLAGINKVLTSHVGRHTFATYMIYKIPLPVVSELMQHSDLDTTSLYLHVKPHRITTELEKVIDWS
jgi:integrase